MVDMTEEQILIDRAKQGDRSALAAIVEEHQQRVYNVALRMCGNQQDAEETLQETFLSVLKALPNFQGRSQLSTWLYRIASNACLMRRRREAARPDSVYVDDADDGELDDYVPKYFVDWSQKPDELLLDTELREVLEWAIQDLPPTLRIVLIWRDLEDRSTAETAEILGITEGAVKVRLHRARLQLRDSLTGYLMEPDSLEAADG